ncbi:MAG: DUF177 domain-containing protein [Nitrospira sp.]|nr:DUF177 domain-containing protein [Nitrospira sp.]
MKVLISEIPVEGLDFDIKETIKSDDLSSPVRGQLRILKIGAEVVVRGNLMADVELQCSRCMKDFRSEVSIPVDVIYHPVEELRGEEKHALRVEELDMGFYSGGILDLFDLIEEQIMLNLPMKPLCNELCKGICLKCGADLNAGDCACNEINKDSRFEELKKLLKE